ncbi:hypothetical protein ADN00_10620 [Ornatilinea apprima]|uniref:Uncharacterized protein n=1 Tax=Ornatilinea apprima TaxID=1134406 RepID=A0A0P6X9X8_9CHLR|nr:hypothetical protein [Ornatilinea apprima]KPL77014.1 hypothetical protein ADN00_10620 [Ornatilinea apprima]
MNKDESIKKIVTLVLKAVGLAMPVAVIVLNALKVMDIESQVPLLAIGLFCLALAMMQSEE